MSAQRRAPWARAKRTPEKVSIWTAASDEAASDAAATVGHGGPATVQARASLIRVARSALQTAIRAATPRARTAMAAPPRIRRRGARRKP